MSPEEENEQRLITEMKCIDATGDELWTYPIPFDTHRATIVMSHVEGGAFAFKCKDTDGVLRILCFDPLGAVQNELVLPDHFYTPTITKNGVFCTGTGADGVAGIWKMDWQGQTVFYPIREAKSINIFDCHAITQDDKATLSIFYRNLDGQMISSVVCVNESEVEWKYDIGALDHWFARQWIKNDMGGITVAAEYYDTSDEDMEKWVHQLCLIFIDAKGAITWKNEFPLFCGFVPTVMEITKEGNYHIWGSASMDDVQTVQRSFRISLDRGGEIVGSELKTVHGDCLRYIDGEVYAVVYSDTDRAALYSNKKTYPLRVPTVNLSSLLLKRSHKQSVNRGAQILSGV